jgi:hypothetical protein
MSTTLAAPTPAPPQEPPRRSRVWLWVVAIVGAVGLVGLVGSALWWTNHPTALSPTGGITSEAVVGKTQAYDAGIIPRHDENAPNGGESATITITKIVPVITQDDAHAVVQVALCDGLRVSAIGGVGPAYVKRTCTHVQPITPGMTFDYNYLHSQQIFVWITARRPGTVSIDGFEVTYSEGLRHGTQFAGNSFVVTAHRPAGSARP